MSGDVEARPTAVALVAALAALQGESALAPQRPQAPGIHEPAPGSDATPDLDTAPAFKDDVNLARFAEHVGTSAARKRPLG